MKIMQADLKDFIIDESQKSNGRISHCDVQGLFTDSQGVGESINPVNDLVRESSIFHVLGKSDTIPINVYR